MSSGNKNTGGNPVTNIARKSPAASNPLVANTLDFLDDPEGKDDEKPEAEDPLEAPGLDDASVLTASAEERLKGRKGRASTILTGGQGLSDNSLSLAKQTLMGK